MQIQQLTYFVTVAEQGSINKAAERLFVTQPNLSKAISNLESELNVHIFDRTNKGVVLTDDGKKLYQYARTILSQMELIQGLSSKERPRLLSIASYPIITMGRLISKFYNNHKQEEIALKLVEQRMQQVIESVESGEAEIGFVMSNNVQVKELKHMLHFKTWYLIPWGRIPGMPMLAPIARYMDGMRSQWQNCCISPSCGCRMITFPTLPFICKSTVSG